MKADDQCTCSTKGDACANCPDCGEELREVNTTDGLFSDFAAYVAAHPGLRLHQAYRNWSGYSKIYGETKDGDLDDLFHKTTKGPQS